MKRLQLRHHDELFLTRKEALDFFENILDPNRVENSKFGYSLYAEPMVVKYKDENDKTQILFAIGTDTPDAPYHIIDSARLDELIIKNQNTIEEEINRAITAEAILKEDIVKEQNRAIEAEETLQANINAEEKRATEAETLLDQKINENLTSIVSVVPSGENILEEYVLRNAKNEILGEHIKIYKDSSLVGAEVNYKGAVSVKQNEDGTFEFSYGTDVDKNAECLYLVYRNEKGNLSLVALDFENFLMETEAGLGIKIIDHKITVNIKDGEKYIIVNEDGLQTVGIDETIKNSVDALSSELHSKIDTEIERSIRVDESLTEELNKLKENTEEIKNEVISNKVVSKDIVVNKETTGTTLTIQTDNVTITKLASASTIYDTNVAVLGTLLSIKNVTPTDSSIKSRYELQGADGKQIGDAIELPKESALHKVEQGWMGDEIDSKTGDYTIRGGNFNDPYDSLNFIYLLQNDTFSLTKVKISDYFTDARFGWGLNNQDGIISLLEGDGNEFLVIGENSIAVTGVSTAIRDSEDKVIGLANAYSDQKYNDASNLIDTRINDVTLSVTELSNTVNNVIDGVKDSLDDEITNRENADIALRELIEAENSSRIESDESIKSNIQTLNDKVALIIGDDKDKNIRTIANEEAAIEVAKVIADAPDSLNTLKEIADYIATDTTNAAQMVSDIEGLKNNMSSINETVDTLINGDVNVAGSVDHKVNDAFNDRLVVNGLPVDNVTLEEAEASSLLRVISIDGVKHYYVTNMATNMLYKKEDGTFVNLNDYITNLNNRIIELETNLETKIIEVLRKAIVGTANEITVTENENGITIGFDENAIFGEY